MRDYREKTVDGYVFNGTDVHPVMSFRPVTVRMTSDERGQTLSIQAENVMIGLPLEAVRDIIKVADKTNAN